jgi:hypothetical protein
MLRGMTTSPGQSVAERIREDTLFLDSAIDSHGFARFLRDYDVIIDVPAARPGGGGSYIKGRYRYRFTHCTEAIARTTVNPKTWQASWDDLFINYQTWEQAGNPSGYVWGVEYADAYPGLSYVEDSPRARHWTETLGHQMHEVRIESNVLSLELVFHDLHVHQLAAGDPDSDTLKPLPA